MINKKPISIHHDMKYQNMYRLVWADGTVSSDMYNLSRAHDILRNYALYRENMRKRGTTSGVDGP